MLKQVEKTKVADEIVDQLKSLILAGHYSPGARLPAERELAKSLGVNRSSLREALKRLEQLGLLSIRQGDGTRVTNFMETAGIELLEHLVPLANSGYPRIIRDAMEFRLCYCTDIIKLAVPRRTEEQLAKLKEYADACAADKPMTLADATEPAFGFWATLVSATHNSVFGLLINSSRNALSSHRNLLAHFLISREAVCKHNYELLDAVTRKDVDDALKITIDYIERSNKHFTDLLAAHKISLPAV